ncbi:MAG TPA: YcaO-like family protein [Candidatus Angelobacter sp.]|jgi:ribosomal protein S12 methylthiotransferase accessory factor|nr:YcaO-like family protein [Candidatus Angelobacter sp.]
MGPQRGKQIGIIELGTVGATALKALLDAGCRDFILGDVRTVSMTDALGNAFYHRSDLNSRRVDALVQRLTPQFPDARFELRAGLEERPWWPKDWLSRCSICLLACDAASESVAFEVNAACLATGTPLLAGLAMGNAGQIGPLVLPGEGPCLHCVDLRVRVAAGRSSFTPPMYAEPALALRVGRTLAEATLEFLAGTAEPGNVLYLWGTDGDSRYVFLSSALCAGCSRFKPAIAYRVRTEFDYRERPASDSRHILELTDRLVNPVGGPIRSLQTFVPTEHDPALIHWIADLADPGWGSFGRTSLYCGGSALEDDVARAAALGEALERASVCPPLYGELLIASYKDIVDDALDPLLWDLYHPETRRNPGFPYLAPSHELPITWAWAYSLTEERPVMVPATRVFSPLRPGAPGDYVDGPIISGFATGNTLEEATLGGLCETLERDAFMIAWANKLPVKRLRLDSNSRNQVGQYLDIFNATSIEVRCFSVLLDLGVHLVISIGRSDRTGEPASVIAAAADIDPGAACRRSLKELSANRLSVRHEMLKAIGPLPSPEPGQLTDETAHGLLYARRDMIRALDFWWEADESIDLSPAPPTETVYQRLFRCVQNIKKAGLHVVVIDLTPPELRPMNLWTVKTIVPGAYPMNFDDRWPQFGGARMTAAPVAAGLRKAPISFADLNRVPHPFP